MVIKLLYNNKLFRIINDFQFKFSNNEVSFQDITIDFTGMSILDIPFKYQELKIYQFESDELNITQGKIIFSGFVDNVNLSEMKNEDEPRELIITMLSPLKLATVRNLSLIGTFEKEEAIRRILQPLLDDGFIIREMNIPSGQITCNFLIQTVEFCMNQVSSKLGLFWTINETKEITVVSIENLFNKQPVKIISGNIRENNLTRLAPSIQNTDYANVINIKKVRMYYETDSYIEGGTGDVENTTLYPVMRLPKNLKNGEEVQFENPIVIDKELLKDIALQHNYWENPIFDNLKMVINNTVFEIGIYYQDGIFGNQDTDNFSYSDSSGERKELVLLRDSFFSNLITGFRWNGSDNAIVQQIQSYTALRYNNVRVLNSNEINEMKGIISDTGMVEKTIDYNEKWATEDEIIEYARSLMTKNTNIINQVVLEYEENPTLKVGDIVRIDAEGFYIQGDFVVKEITYRYINEYDQNWIITLKNADMLSTFIDLFRPVTQQEQATSNETSMISEYVEDVIYERHEIQEVQ